MPILILSFIVKVLSRALSSLKLGNGSTWPGHIALKLNKHLIRQIFLHSKAQLIVIAGTNGKTTTAKFLREILVSSKTRVLQNSSGANLLNGLASSLLINTDWRGRLQYEYVVFEVDENTLPLLLKETHPEMIVLLNLFRDQLDRYGEVHSIAEKWKNALENYEGRLILNADDPEIAFLATDPKAKVHFFGLKSTLSSTDHAADSVYCPKCHSRLQYHKLYYSHLGDWECLKCRLKRPQPELERYDLYPLSGIYNQYNTHAAVLTAQLLGATNSQIQQTLREVSPAFGRQEIIQVGNKKAQLFLAKNPTSFNQSLRTVKELKAQNLLIALNDGIADGQDVSWIWDTEIEKYITKVKNITLAGERAYDLGLRLKYLEDLTLSCKTEPRLDKAIQYAFSHVEPQETLYILPTYTAMLQVRKILTGKKIL